MELIHWTVSNLVSGFLDAFFLGCYVIPEVVLLFRPKIKSELGNLCVLVAHLMVQKLQELE